MNTLPILERLYRLPARRLVRPRPLRRLLRSALARLQTHTAGLTITGCGVALWVLSHIYYFNMLAVLESNVITARAQIEVAQERRNHVQRDLTQLLRFYARYEKELLKEVTVIRKRDVPVEKLEPVEALARLDAVAEQYPNLQLTHTVQQLSEAIVTSETNVALRASEYNQAVNLYTNELRQFPGNVFGPVMGFREKPFYSPQEPSALEYRELAP